MSKLTDYSKFDNLSDDSDCESIDSNDESARGKQIGSEENKTPYAAACVIRRDEKSGRCSFLYNGRAVYEFEQSLDDVTIYVIPPPHVRKGRQINCVISANHFKLGLVGHGSWFLNEGTYGTVDVDESTWTLEDCDSDDATANNNKSKNKSNDRKKIIVITLVKANRGTVWEAALKGNSNAAGGETICNRTNNISTIMDPLSKEQVKKDLMLQRFQEENPGFDFSGADFNGSIPDAREFMGGVKYQ